MQMRTTTRNVMVFCSLVDGEWVTAGKLAAETRYSPEEIATTIGSLISSGYSIASKTDPSGCTEWKLEGFVYEEASHKEKAAQ